MWMQNSMVMSYIQETNRSKFGDIYDTEVGDLLKGRKKTKPYYLSDSKQAKTEFLWFDFSDGNSNNNLNPQCFCKN